MHTSTTVWFAVVFVGTSLGELHGEGVTFLSQLFAHGDGLLVDPIGDGIFVEDDVVRSGLVVDPILLRYIEDS